MALTAWQNVILRNYGTMPVSVIAQAIGTESGIVTQEASRMGLSGISQTIDWRKRGFVTVIRNNYDLLSYGKLAEMLDMSEEAFIGLLGEYDFLDIKLGKQPPLPDVSYRPLNESQIRETERVASILIPHIRLRKVPPFDFFRNAIPYEPPFGEFSVSERFTSSYHADYAGALGDDNLFGYDDDDFKRLTATGTNGLWLSDTLRNLAPFSLDAAYEGDYKRRIRNFQRLTERAAVHGVKIYLYLNEPRSLPAAFFEGREHLRGSKCAGGYCLCTSASEVKSYLYDAMKYLGEQVPLLGGVMTITMSENPTHCRSLKWNGRETTPSCPRCRDRKPIELAVEINNIFSRALHDSGCQARVIANLWAWSELMNISESELRQGIELLNKDVDIMCVSETAKRFVRGGVEAEIADYSISVVGPSEISRRTLAYAKKKGHRIWAKVQINNSWECAGVPYIPAFGLMAEHIRNCKEQGIEGLMLGWSLGGYPGGALPLINRLCLEKSMDEKEWYAEVYGERANRVCEAVKAFDNAFLHFPFSLKTIYFGGQNLACGNLWTLAESERRSTMVCFTFDDHELWTKPYGLDVYLSQMEKLCREWEEGMALLVPDEKNAAYHELCRVARACYIHFASARNLAVWTKYKLEPKKNRESLILALENERTLTCELLSLIAQDARIGFEMTNHYFYNENLLLAKLLNLDELEQCLKYHLQA